MDIRSNSDVTIYRNVRNDNTIVYESNRYSLPLGTYNNQKEVSIEAKGSKLAIMAVFGELIYEHTISTGKGQLIKSTSHSRDVTDSMDKAQNTVDELLLFKATAFLQTIRTEKARYARDRFRLLQTLCDKYGIADVLSAINYCEVSRLFGITYVKDYLEHNAKPKVVVIRAECLRPEYRTADKQLVLATGGFGTYANARGRAVYTTNLYSCKEARWNREDILGIVKPEYMPDWAKERLKQLEDESKSKQKRQEQER